MRTHTERGGATRWLGIAAGLALALATMGSTGTLAAAKSPAERAAELLAQMTLDEKIALVRGDGFRLNAGHAGHIPANERLGIPELYLVDGPNGVGNGSKGVTAYPAAINTASTWDTTLVRRYGEAVGREQAGKGNNVALTPTINILRVPEWGRSFETFSEDPYLTSQLAVAHIQGIQSQGVIATAKHYVANNQEIDRDSIDVRVSERALREIYLPGFRAAAQEANVGAVMCAYNRVNGHFACEHPWALTTVLKEEWGFEGFVMSDWFATHSTVAAANAGLDMEMPAGATGFAPEYFGQALKQAVDKGEVTGARLDDMVRRILTSMFQAGLFDRPAPSTRDAIVSGEVEKALARELAEKGMVLLKNAGSVLPFDESKVTSVAIIGDASGENAKLTGGGSAAVIPSRVRSPIDGITERAGGQAKVTFAPGTAGVTALPAVPSEWLAPPSGEGRGLEASYYASPDLTAAPVLTRIEASPELKMGPPPVEGLQPGWVVQWKGTLHPKTSGIYRFSLEGGGESKIVLDGKVVVANRSQFGSISHGMAKLVAATPVPVMVELRQTGFAFGARLQVGALPPNPALIEEAVGVARAADVAVVFVNDVITEGADRTTLALPGDQDRLIDAVAEANPRTVVVLNTGGPVLMPWLDRVAAVIEAWYAGQEYGDAIAAVLFGDVNPSGKLPMTFPASDAQGAARTPRTFPGDGKSVLYEEDLLVGYRWFDAKGEAPLFAFGFGLSYTKFAYDALRVEPQRIQGAPRLTISAQVRNVGGREGAEISQLYLGFPASAGEPPRLLRGFEKVVLAPGSSETVSFHVGAADLEHWDATAKAWRIAKGEYQVAVGGSSRHLPLEGRFVIE